MFVWIPFPHRRLRHLFNNDKCSRNPQKVFRELRPTFKFKGFPSHVISWQQNVPICIFCLNYRLHLAKWSHYVLILDQRWSWMAIKRNVWSALSTVHLLATTFPFEVSPLIWRQIPLLGLSSFSTYRNSLAIWLRLSNSLVVDQQLCYWSSNILPSDVILMRLIKCFAEKGTRLHLKQFFFLLRLYFTGKILFHLTVVCLP